jgi:hypothetical protein
MPFMRSEGSLTSQQQLDAGSEEEPLKSTAYPAILSFYIGT